VLTRIQLLLKAPTHFSPPTNGDPLTGRQEVLFIGMGFASNNKDNPRRIPGQSNEEIAARMLMARRLALRLNVRVHLLAQREVAEAIEKQNPACPIDKVLQEEGGESHIDSTAILGQAWEYAKEHEVCDAVLFTHYRHAFRCLWTAELWGFNAELWPQYAHSYTWQDRPSQTQPHTWCAPIFFVWDILGRGKLVAIDYPKIAKRQ
jgi:hypothetical protein